jgi:hypothetical protein
MSGCGAFFLLRPLKHKARTSHFMSQLSHEARPSSVVHTGGRMTTFDEALAHSNAMAAWDYQSRGHARLCIHDVGEGGARLVACTQAEDRAETAARVRDKGLRLGGMHRDCAYVWVMDGAGIAIWSDKARLVNGLPGDVVRVKTFIGTSDAAAPGVSCEKQDGSEVVIVEERDDSWRNDPTYDRMSLDEDLEWAFYLGQDLALWLGVPHQDYGGGIVNEDALVVRAKLHALASLVEAQPAIGEFAHVQMSLGAQGKAGDVVLRFAPNPLELDRRFVELKVSTKGGERWRGRWIAQGTNPQIAVFLRETRTPIEVLSVADGLLQKLSGEP